MNRSPFFVAQSPNNLSLDNMFTNSPFSFVVSRLNPRVNDKREPILKAIANLADKLSDVLICVLTPPIICLNAALAICHITLRISGGGLFSRASLRSS
jgi:hypothetical protein